MNKKTKWGIIILIGAGIIGGGIYSHFAHVEFVSVRADTNPAIEKLYFQSSHLRVM